MESRRGPETIGTRTLYTVIMYFCTTFTCTYERIGKSIYAQIDKLENRLLTEGRR